MKHSLSTNESKIPTQTFLLPGQQFCVGLPWERADLPKHGLPPAPPAPLPSVNPFDKKELEADPCAGWEIGNCEVIRRLSTSSAKSLLAVRNDPREGTALVALRQLELPDEGMQELLEHAHWASHFRHANLARVYGCEAGDEGIFWITEFASGATLSEISAACRKIGKSVPVGLALSTAYEAALALVELHVPGAHAHGFVSDESLFVTFDGHSKLMELGLFRCISGKLLRPDGLQAMAPYLAPEQVANGRLPDPKSDVYALAAVLHECLSGQKLPNGFERRPQFVPPSSFNVALGKELDTVMMKALSTDRAQRYRTAAEFAVALKSASFAFMWKAPQRADFVGQLFATRKRREQVLLAGCEEKMWAPKRPPTAPQLPAVDIDVAEPPFELPVELAATLTKSMRAQPGAAVKTKRPKQARRAKARALSLLLVACALGFVWERALVDRFLAPAYEPRAMNASVSLGRVPPQPPASALHGLELMEEAAEQTLAQARSLTFDSTERPKVKAAARKKRDEAPLPPWLAKSKHR